MRVLAKEQREPALAFSGEPKAAHSFDTALFCVRQPEEYEIDEMQHINNVVYLAWAQDAGTAHWSLVADENVQERFGWVGTQHDIKYGDEIPANGTAEIRTWLDKPRGPVMARNVDVRSPGAASFPRE